MKSDPNKYSFKVNYTEVSKAEIFSFTKFIKYFLFSLFLLFSLVNLYPQSDMEYTVFRTTVPVEINADWNKPAWKDIPSINITNYMADIPDFKPVTQAKMLYDDENLYLIFHVEDKFVTCVTDKINGPVWEDGCVEFFFAPDVDFPLHYYNLEINCIGVPLMHHNTIPRAIFTTLKKKDIKKVNIAHSIPRPFKKDINENINWTIEYSIPLSVLRKYSEVTQPEKGVVWKANFYKISEKGKNPHFITWAPVKKEKPDFHVPEDFGRLIFQ